MQKTVDFGIWGFSASDILHLELVEPGADVDGELATDFFWPKTTRAELTDSRRSLRAEHGTETRHAHTLRPT